MNNKRATKRALLTSVMALVMCVVMLVGTTFAWFTDTASTGVNKIQAGNLKVDIIGETGNDHVEKLDFTKKVNVTTDGGTTEVTPAAEIFWEPGCRYLTEGFRIANKGNLALKWKAVVNKGTTAANEGNFDLLDVIDFYLVRSTDVNDMGTALGEFSDSLKAKTNSDVYYIKGVMKTTAGNDYQGLTLDGISITVYATQDTVENDSFDNQYDKNATYYPVLDAAGMKDALVNGGNIKVDANIAPTEALVATKKTTIDMNGKTIANTADVWKTETNSWSLISARSGADLTITGNGTFAAKENDCYAVDVQDGATVTIENGTFIGNIHAVYVLEGTAYIKGGFYSVQQKYPDASKANEFVLNCLDANYKNDTANIIVTGGTFVNFNPADCQAEGAHTNFLADGYSVISEKKANGDTWYTVVEGTAVKEPTNEAFADAVASVENGGTVVLPAGDYTIPANAKGKTLTITGTEGAKIECVKAGEGDYGLDSATVTFKGVTLDFGEQDFNGYVRAKATYIDCTINGRITLGGESTFTNCTFNNMAGYNVWTWGSDATFENCTFNCGGKSVLVYGGSTSTVTINRCTFNDLGGFDGKAAIETGSSYGESFTININKVTVNGFAVNPEGISTNSTIWANKNSMPKDRLNVVIDGTKVY